MALLVILSVALLLPTTAPAADLDAEQLAQAIRTYKVHVTRGRSAIERGYTWTRINQKAMSCVRSTSRGPTATASTLPTARRTS